MDGSSVRDGTAPVDRAIVGPPCYAHERIRVVLDSGAGEGRVKGGGTHLSGTNLWGASGMEGGSNAPGTATNNGGQVPLSEIAIVIGPGGAFTGSTRHR